MIILGLLRDTFTKPTEEAQKWQEEHNKMTEQNKNSNTNDTNQNDILHLELSDELKRQEIVTNYVYDITSDNLCLELNHKYNRKIIICPIKSDWSKFIETYTKELNRKGIRSPDHISMICDVADNNALRILEQRRNSQQQAQKEEAAAMEEEKESAAQKIIKLVKEQCQELFIDQYGTPYAAVKVRDHIETLSLGVIHPSQRFKNWLCRTYYNSEGGSVPNSENITNALNVLKANAEFDACTRTRELHLRVAADGSTTIYYDLCNKEWEVIKITPEGWTIEKAPIIFRRYINNQPQVYPSKDYPSDIFDRFMKLLNVKGEENNLLLKCYIIALFIPGFPEPILMLHGDPGGAKTTHQELIKMLVDPSSVLTLVLPREINELIQQLAQRRVVYYDNLSEIPDWISDQFCRASTGGGSSKRMLFTDEDEIIYNFMLCIGFNGINLAATKADLLDRGLIIEIEKLEKVREKKEIWKEFEEIRPQLLGYILDILVKVLRMKQTTSIAFEALPRMADFTRDAEIISRCMGNPDNRFLNAYYKNIKLQTEASLESSFVATVTVKFMEDKQVWKDTSSVLLMEFDTVAEEIKPNMTRHKEWPKTPAVLSRRLNEIKLTLRQIGISIERGYDESGKKKVIKITKNEADDNSSSDGSRSSGGGWDWNSNTHKDEKGDKNTSNVSDIPDCICHSSSSSNEITSDINTRDKTSTDLGQIQVREMSSESTEPTVASDIINTGLDSCSNLGKIPDGISDDIVGESEMPSGDCPQNRAQNDDTHRPIDIYRISLSLNSPDIHASNNSDITSDRIVAKSIPTNIPASLGINPKPDDEPTLPSYVHRSAPQSDRFVCRYCKITDDKWGMAKHSHSDNDIRYHTKRSHT